MEQEIKQEQPTQELEDQKVETVSGGRDCFIPNDNEKDKWGPQGMSFG